MNSFFPIWLFISFEKLFKFGSNKLFWWCEWFYNRPVFERTVYFPSYHSDVWGSDPGCVAGWLKVKGKKEQQSRCKYSISILFFVSLIYIYIFSFFQLILSPVCYLMPGCSNLFSCILLKRPQLGVPITMFAVLQRTRLMSNTTWKDLRNVPDSHRSSVLSACNIDSAGLLSVEEWAALHTSQIHGLYFHFAVHFS